MQVDFGLRDEVLKRRTRNYTQLVKGASGAQPAEAAAPGADGVAAAARGNTR